jgi:hypothetical protein
MARLVYLLVLALLSVRAEGQAVDHRASAWGEIVWGASMPNTPVRLFGELGVRTNNQQAVYSLSVQKGRWTTGVRNFSFETPSAPRMLEIRPYVGYLWQGPVGTEGMSILARAEWRSVVGGASRPRLRLWVKSDRLPLYAEALWTLPDLGLTLDPFVRYRLGGIWAPSQTENPVWALEWIPLVEFGGGPHPVLWSLRMRCRYEVRTRRMVRPTKATA